jgi:hypothetical protein
MKTSLSLSETGTFLHCLKNSKVKLFVTHHPIELMMSSMPLQQVLLVTGFHSEFSLMDNLLRWGLRCVRNVGVASPICQVVGEVYADWMNHEQLDDGLAEERNGSSHPHSVHCSAHSCSWHNNACIEIRPDTNDLSAKFNCIPQYNALLNWISDAFT